MNCSELRTAIGNLPKLTFYSEASYTDEQLEDLCSLSVGDSVFQPRNVEERDNRMDVMLVLGGGIYLFTGRYRNRDLAPMVARARAMSGSIYSAADLAIAGYVKAIA